MAITTGSELGELATERLEAEITTLAAHLAAATCRWLLMLAEYDRRQGFAAWECVSMEHWLSVHAGIAPSTARAHMAVARDLGGLPVTTAAFADGRLSYSKVRALCRVATAANEAEWVELALQASASQLERLTGDVRRVTVAADAGTAAAQQDQRSLSWGWTDDGMLRVHGLLPPETGAVLVRLLHEAADAQRADERRAGEGAAGQGQAGQGQAGEGQAGEGQAGEGQAGERPTGGQRMADALGLVLRRVGSAPAGRPLVVVHRDQGGTCRIEHGPPIPPAVADELACDGETTTATHSEAGISYDRRRRFPAAALRRHVHRRDGGCVFPGCGRRLGVSTHHIREYAAHQGETTKENLIVLCAAHHGAIHRRGWAVSGSAEDGTLRFTDPTGQVVPRPPAAGGAHGVESGNHQRGIRPQPHTPQALAMGGRADHAHAVWVLANWVGGRDGPRRAGPASAEAHRRPD